MKSIFFADLTHQGHSCNAVPYGVAAVAAYAQKSIGAEISCKLVTKPEVLASMLTECEPSVVCFSCYNWNSALSSAFARRIKMQYPDCITIFGGPDYPVTASSQHDYLAIHPEIDFFVFREGEFAFVDLYHALKSCDFAVAKLKEQKMLIHGCHYYNEGVLLAGAPQPLISPLDQLPSPYLTGMCDEFLALGHTAIIQTVRGCPFSCTYCQDGNDYYSSVRRYSADRIEAELERIAGLAKSPTLFLADSNFGMYPEDALIAEKMAQVQQRHGWPEFVVSISGKNNKDLVLKTAAAINGGMFSAAIQSSDPVVLGNINRSNVSVQELIEAATDQELHNNHSFSELIVALPGDTLDAHRKSATDLIEAGIHVVRSHQLIMLAAAEVATVSSRKKFGLQTRFRVIHNTFGSYELFGESFRAPEVDEICVGSDTMSFQDYLDCRCFDLTMEIFFNNGVFAELHTFLKKQGIAVSALIMLLNVKVRQNPQLAALYDGFLIDTQELWSSRKALEDFLGQPGVPEHYESGELGRNEQLAYKGLALFENMGALIALAYDAAAELLQQSGRVDSLGEDFLQQLLAYDLLRKGEPLSVDEERSGFFNYDFCALRESGFKAEPLEYRLTDVRQFYFTHSETQRSFVTSKKKLLTSGLHGYAAVISMNPKIREYFREISVAGRFS